MGVRKNRGCQVAFHVKDATSPYASVVGQSAAVTLYLSKDGATPVLLGAVTEMDPTNMQGVYYRELTASETNADTLVVFPVWVPGTPSTVEFSPTSIEIHTDLDWEGSVFGSGFVGSTDSLEDISVLFNDQLKTFLASGRTNAVLSGTGWLSRVTDKAYRWVDEPAANDKFDVTAILELLRGGIRELFGEILLHGTKTPVVTHAITLVDEQIEYTLPPTIGRVVMVGHVDTDQERPDWWLRPTHRLDPGYGGYIIEGNTLRLTGKNELKAADGPLTLWYIPSGEIYPHEGTLLSIPDSLTVELASTPTDGTLDTRKNAYEGYMFRVLTAGGNDYDQEVMISSYDHTTRLATLRRPLEPLPTAPITYEVVPTYSVLFEDVLAIHMARAMSVSLADSKKFKLLSQIYSEKKRAFRLQLSKTQDQEASRYDYRDYRNIDLDTFWSAF